MVIESGGLTPNTARFTASRDPAALADRGKGGLKYLYTEKAFLDSTKPAGSVNIRIETIAHYLRKHAERIIAKWLAASAFGCPLPTSQSTKDKR